MSIATRPYPLPVIGNYSAPREMQISGIDAVVVDPHNEVLPYWFRFEGKPAVVVHIDRHNDMIATAMPKLPNDDMALYSRTVGISTFIAAARYYGGVSATYHLEAHSARIDAYGRLLNGRPEGLPRTGLFKGRIFWIKDSLPFMTTEPKTITTDDFFRDFSSYAGGLIADIDLDGFACLSRSFYSKPLAGHLEDAMQRIRWVMNLLERIPRPGLVTIARSQTPYAFTPPELVDEIEARVIQALDSLYAGR
ncbi:UPF0489 family protein [Candidatus Woesearchaeota archaeon]|nr:UPF0489 family protein [Candidatus Woesearchaeota archaeon]